MQLFDLVNVIIEVAIVLFYCSTLYEAKSLLNIKKALIVFSAVIIVTGCGMLRLPTAANLFVSYILCFALSTLLFKGNLVNKLFFSVIYVVVIIVVDIIVTLIITFFGISYSMTISDNITYIVGATLSNFIRLWVCAYIGRILSRRIHALPLSYWIFMLVCPVLSVMCLIVFDIYLMQAEEVNQFLVFIPSACILYINFMLFRFFETYSSNIRLKVEAELSAQKEENYKVLKASEDEMRTLRHDMKNHILVMHEIIRNRDFEAAERHLGGVEKTMKNVSSVVYTSNSALDAAVNIGGRKAQLEGVSYTVQVQMERDLQVAEADISSLITNAVDNAVEAARECDEKYIFIEIKVSDEVKIHMENSTLIKENKRIFKTAKSDKKNHGLGIRSMKSIAKRYDGFVMHEAKEGVFYLDVTLKNKKID